MAIKSRGSGDVSTLLLGIITWQWKRIYTTSSYNHVAAGTTFTTSRYNHVAVGTYLHYF